MNSFHRRRTRAAQTSPDAARPIERHGLIRLDSLLVSQGLAASRTAAQRMIAAGRVMRDGLQLHKPALELPASTALQVANDEDERFVSRGGLKLAGALASTGILVSSKTCLDVGQSTGGFTDCLLQSGARHVFGVDVGHGQLHPKLFANPAVTAIESVNCRNLTAASLGPTVPVTGFELIVADVSFISLTLILPQLPALLAAKGDLLLLVKPQFEVGPSNIGKGGIVRDPALYRQVQDKLCNFAQNLGLTLAAWLDSPITGGDGNREFFIWLKK